MPNPISLMMVPWEPRNRPPSVFLRVFVASAPSLHCRRLKTNRVRGIIRFLRDRWRITFSLSLFRLKEKSDHSLEVFTKLSILSVHIADVSLNKETNDYFVIESANTIACLLFFFQ